MSSSQRDIDDIVVIYLFVIVTNSYCSCMLQWLSPSDYIKDAMGISLQFCEMRRLSNFSHLNELVVGISPQSYEMRRLSNFSHLNELEHFAKNRQQLGTSRLMSVRINCRDATIFALPGIYVFNFCVA